MRRHVLVAGVMLAALSVGAARAVAQDCTEIEALLLQGRSVLQIARATGLSTAQVQACRRVLRQRQVISPVGPPPHGAPGPAPHGAAGPPPHGAAGPAPFGEPSK